MRTETFPKFVQQMCAPRTREAKRSGWYGEGDGVGRCRARECSHVCRMFGRGVHIVSRCRVWAQLSAAAAATADAAAAVERRTNFCILNYNSDANDFRSEGAWWMWCGCKEGRMRTQKMPPENGVSQMWCRLFGFDTAQNDFEYRGILLSSSLPSSCGRIGFEFVCLCPYYSVFGVRAGVSQIMMMTCPSRRCRPEISLRCLCVG